MTRRPASVGSAGSTSISIHLIALKKASLPGTQICLLGPQCIEKGEENRPPQRDLEKLRIWYWNAPVRELFSSEKM